MTPFARDSRRVAALLATLMVVTTAWATVPRRSAAADRPVATVYVAENPDEVVRLTESEQEIVEALRRGVHWEFVETPLRDVVSYIQNRYGIQVTLDDASLRKMGVTPESPVSQNLTWVDQDCIALNNGLWLILRDLGLVHVVHDDALLITTPPEARRLTQQGAVNPDTPDLWRRNSRVFQTLAEPTHVEFIETPIADVVEYLQDLHGVPVQFDRRALRKAKIGLDTPLTRNLKGITLSRALRLMLRELQLTHIVSHEMVLITTHDARPQLLTEGGFDVHDFRYAPVNRGILVALNGPTNLDFVKTPLVDVVDDCKDLHHLEIQLDLFALDKADIDYDTPVTAKYTENSLREALEGILGNMGLTFVVHYECVLITTPAEARRLIDGGAVDPATTAGDLKLASERAAAALEQPVSIQLNDKRFDEIIEALEQRCQVKIWADPWSLAAAGVRSDASYGIRTSDAPLRSALEMLLRGTGLSPVVEGDQIVIAEPLPDPLKTIIDIRRLGGRVSIDHRRPNVPVDGVDFPRGSATPKVFGMLRRFPEISMLSLPGPEITDDVFDQLTTFTQLRTLDLGYTSITDRGAEHLRNMPQLERLVLHGTGLTNVGLKQIAKLHKLQRLDVSSTEIDDSGLASLTELTELHSLQLSGTQVTGAGLKHLAGAGRLTWLQLDDARITDEGLRQLTNLPQLRYLSLEGNEITDAGLESIARLKKLVRVWLRDTNVTAAGIARLRRELPRVWKIDH